MPVSFWGSNRRAREVSKKRKAAEAEAAKQNQEKAELEKKIARLQAALQHERELRISFEGQLENAKAQLRQLKGLRRRRGDALICSVGLY